jgi:hypothetical protein
MSSLRETVNFLQREELRIFHKNSVCSRFGCQ